jgi:CheY-like chemotaxis protein
MISLRVAGEGFDGRFASDGKKAINALSASRSDLVIIELHKPPMNDWQLLERMWSDPHRQFA